MKRGRQNKQEPIPCFLPAFPQKGCAGYVGGQQQAAEQELVGQLFSAFCSSARKNFAAVFGGHSLSEAVLFLSLKLLWLIGSEHSLSPSLQDETLQNRIIDKISPKVKRGPAFFFLPVF